LAYIAISKYVDALPLYRLEKIFKRMKIDLPRNTMASWMIKLSEKLTPLYNLMEEDLLASNYVCCDETRIQVLKEPEKKPESMSYMWVRTRHGPGINPIVLFDYDPTRSGTVPQKLLEGFKGYLQADGYAGYDGVCQNSEITRVACMAHIRRKFFEAYKASNDKDLIAEQAIKIIQRLYQIEEKIRDKPITERLAARQTESTPIMNELQVFLSSNQDRHPPQSLLGKAFAYAVGQWSHMLNYLKDGQVEIDNNFTENRIRPFAIGRKNWLFSDSVGGAKASAMLYSIIQTACGNGLEPYAYLKHVFTHLPASQTAEQIEKLLPHKIDFKVLN
jgi:transposase